MSTKTVSIIPTGVANIASIIAAVGRLQANSKLVETPEEIESADYLILPGVGAFGAGMDFLNSHALVQPLKKRISELRPTCTVCLGFQLLAPRSEEAEGVQGLGAHNVSIVKFPKKCTTPQFGWNHINVSEDSHLVESGYAYFANSFYLPEVPQGWLGSKSQHGLEFISMIEKGPILGCQFHPELSGAWGHKLLMSWLSKS